MRAQRHENSSSNIYNIVISVRNLSSKFTITMADLAWIGETLSLNKIPATASRLFIFLRFFPRRLSSIQFECKNTLTIWVMADFFDTFTHETVFAQNSNTRLNLTSKCATKLFSLQVNKKLCRMHLEAKISFIWSHICCISKKDGKYLFFLCVCFFHHASLILIKYVLNLLPTTVLSFYFCFILSPLFKSGFNTAINPTRDQHHHIMKYECVKSTNRSLKNISLLCLLFGLS